MFNVGLFGKSKPANAVSLTSRTMPRNVYDAGAGSWSVVSYTLAANGQANGTDGSYVNQWLTPVAAGVGAGYEVKFTRLNPSYTNVTLAGGYFGSWLSLSSSKTIYTNALCDLYGDPQETIRVEIRAVGSETILATANITFQ